VTGATRNNIFTSLRYADAESAEDGRLPLFQQLKVLVFGENGTPPFAVMAEKLGISEGAVKVAAHRFHHRFKKLLQAEVAQTVTTPGEVAEELRYLISKL